MSELEFTPVGLEDYDRIYEKTSKYGEGSCQHSPVNMYSMQEKYGDSVCERDGFLYTLRSGLCDEDYRVYLAPFGGGDVRRGFQTIFADAAFYGKKVRFITLTEKYAKFLETEFPEKFDFEEDRNLAEYCYLSEKMSAFSGGELVTRRKEVRRFFREYGERTEISLLEQPDFPDIMDFEEDWLLENAQTHDSEVLEREARFIERHLEQYDSLKLSGIVLRIDGEVKGFCYGTKLSEDYYDGIIQKADRRIPNIYKVLTMELVKRCTGTCRYFNIEEDLGVPGLRTLKCAYHPDHLILKYRVTER